ncbi:MAG: glycyl radical protein [Promethearchaeota archaeon]|jgi:formate C-acetyltransferase
MVEAIEEPTSNIVSMWAKYYTIEPTTRVEKLRQRYLSIKNKVIIDIARERTKSRKKTEGEPLVTRRAKAFAAIVRGVPTNIYPDELFVGWLFSEPRGTEIPFYSIPFTAFGLEKELDTLSTRTVDPFQIDDDDKNLLREEIYPYWKDHFFLPSVPPEARKMGVQYPITCPKVDHYVVNYPKVLKKGLLGVKRDAEERLNRIDLTDSDEVKKVPFLEGVIIAIEAAAEIGKRFAVKARSLAEIENDDKRKAELLQIAENCENVPANPARTFYEALQSVWFIHMMLGWELSFHGGISIGRADQYLYPYYEKDIREGKLTKEQAQELIDCWCMRFSQSFGLWTQGGFISQYTPGHHLDIGGLNADGTDATTELSYMFIEAIMHTPGMVEPAIGLLVHSKTPDSLLIKACQLTSVGSGNPQYVNHDVLVNNLMGRGATVGGKPVTLEMARKYGGCVGCHEPSLHTMEGGWAVNQSQLLGLTMEIVMTNGWSRIFGKRRGLETGDPREFKTFEDVREAFRKQVAFEMKRGAIASALGEQMLEPTLFTSALTEDCIENGTCREDGGARYSLGAVTTLGTVDAGNSLAAIKKLVFDEKKITMDQLCKALENDFEGYEDIHKMCLEAPKFGNDDDYADEQVVWVSHLVATEAMKYKTTYGGTKYAYQVPMSSYVPHGLMIGALPSGRKSRAPVSDGVSPTMGSDMNGPTAVLKSIGKINNAELSLGQSLNMKLDPIVFEADDGLQRLASLIRVFVDQKADHMQINVVSAATLKAAQKDPEGYKDLVVKVAGYNARFVDLHKLVQDSIIARTEHRLA